MKFAPYRSLSPRMTTFEPSQCSWRAHGRTKTVNLPHKPVLRICIVMLWLPARGRQKVGLMLKRYFVAASTLLTPVAVAGQTPPANVPTPKLDDVTVIGQQPARSKLICERIVVTGSIKSQKICRTQAEFDQLRTDSLTEIERMRDEQSRNRQMGINCQFLEMC